MNTDEGYEDWCEENEERAAAAFTAEYSAVGSPGQLAEIYYIDGWLRAAYQGEVHLLEIARIVGADDVRAEEKLQVIRKLIAEHCQ
jgi:hypothetical protein